MTGLVSKIVRDFIVKKKTVIEVNIEGAIVNGKRYLVEGRAEQVCQEMITEYVRLRSVRKC